MSAVRCVWSFLVEFSKIKNVENKKASPSVSLSDSRRSLSEGALTKNQKDSISAEEVSKHNTPTDCWIIINNKVYDVTDFGLVHPGGSLIFTQGGRDATEVFASFHAASSWSLLKKHYIGDLQGENPRREGLEEDFRRLRGEFKKDGLFETSWWFYCWKLLLNLSILLTAAVVLFGSDGNGVPLLLSAFLLALFFQQSGWLAHDFCHHQVFKNRTWNNIFGLFLGNVWQGFSVDWWKTKHNKHHAVTNEIDGSHLAVDPDIDTLPLLAWSQDMLKTLKNPAERALIRYQHYIFIPVLLLARFSWAQQSFSHSLKVFLSGEKPIEFLLILLHYSWHFGIAFLALPAGKAVVYLVVCQALSGFMLGFAFVQSHNGMEIHNQDLDFVTAQVITTRNIKYSTFVDFFMGGLNFQIEHHLFPTMPRHNLQKARIEVKKLCEKHGLPYEECSMATGTKRVVQRLMDIARHA